MIITFVDASVLIAAIRGLPEVSLKAIEFLEDSNRAFASSDFVRLEVLPKAIYHNEAEEREIYESFFAKVLYWAEDVEGIVRIAYSEAVKCGLNACDALHVAAALLTKSDEIVTAEKSTKPLCRVQSISVESISSD